MGELKYTEFQKTLETRGRQLESFPVFLIFGDELLCSRVMDELVKRLLDGASKTHNFEPIEGQNENVREALERLNTFSLLSTRKVVALKDARVFYSKKQNTDLLQKARDAAGRDRMDRAALFLCDLLGLLGLQFEDLKNAEAVEGLLDGYDPGRDRSWFDRTVAEAREKNMVPGAAADVQNDIEQAAVTGFPKGHFLLITTDYVDRRRSLYKVLAEKGMVVDCTVSSGQRAAGRSEQEAVIREIVGSRLANAGKRMDREAIALLVEKTGTELRLLTGNLDRLIDFAGDREQITLEDVELILQRTRQDPLYAFTNAVTDRNLSQSLFYVNSLLGGGVIDHPLPLLTAVVNQIRKLLVVKDFIGSRMGGVWRPSLSYPLFQKHVYPAVQDFDKHLADRLEGWRQSVEKGPAEATGKGKKGKQKKGPSSDIFLTRPARSPYPLFKLFVKSDRFTREELVRALEMLAEADARLKQSGSDGKLVLEQVLFHICGTKHS